MSATLTRLLTVTASTKRNPAASGGKVAIPAAHLTSLAIMPLMPVTNEIAEYYRLHSPRESFVTYASSSADVLEGDLMTVSSVIYNVQAVGAWPTDNGFTEIILGLKRGT